jgi:hypothetical protein
MSLVPTGRGNYAHPEDPGESGYKSGPIPRLSVTDKEAGHLARLFAGKTVIEFGTGIGVSTKAIASTAKHVYTCDPDPWVRSAIVPGLPVNVSFFVEFPDNLRADGAFIDGHHGQDETLADIRYAAEHTNCDPLVIHDTNINSVSLGIGHSEFRIKEIFGGPCYMAILARIGVDP